MASADGMPFPQYVVRIVGATCKADLVMILRVGLWAALIVATNLYAETDDDKRQLTAVQAKIRAVGADVSSLVGEKNAQLEQLKRMEKQYGEQINALNTVKAEIQRKQQSLQQIRSNLSALQQSIYVQQQALEGLIKSAHVMGDRQRLSMVLSQQDPALSGRMMVYFDYISKARLQKLESIAQDLSEQQQLETQQQTETELLQVDLDKRQQQANALQALRQQREALLAQIDHDYALKHGELAQLIRDEKKLAALVASLQKTDDNESAVSVRKPESASPEVEDQAEIVASPVPVRKIQPRAQAVNSGKAFVELKGQLPWPVQGSINESFGSRRFEITLDGTVIGAREGAEIRAVADGRVVYADWLRGYGLMIIVDHGKGYMSLYAYNQNLYKTVGQSVRAGESLATVGRSGGRSEPALYFGIRAHGQPVNPEHWCRKPVKN